MIKQWTHYIAAALFAVVLGIAPTAPEALAQSRAAGTGMSANNMLEANCLDSVRRLDALVRELQTFAEQLQFCNNNRQVYTGAGCTSLVGLEHAWLPDVANPTSLIFTDNGVQVGDAVDVIVGQPGESAVCPGGTTPEEPGEEPEVEPEVDDPEPPVDPEPSCTWRASGPYATQQTTPDAVMDSACGHMEYSPCVGCANFPSTSNCEVGAACDPDALRNCLKNQRRCGIGPDAPTMWDRYQCMCR